MIDIEHHIIRLHQDAEELRNADPVAFREFIWELLKAEFEHSEVVMENLNARNAS
jgi:hypothetical protein